MARNRVPAIAGIPLDATPPSHQDVRNRVQQPGDAMPQIGLRAAARLSGKNTSTIHRAMLAGRLSYTLDASGSRQIDTAELERVFGPLHRPNGNAAIAQPSQSHSTHSAEIAALERLLNERERLLADREATIADLRKRLNSLTALLTDQRTHRQTGSVPSVAPQRLPWWRRLLR